MLQYFKSEDYFDFLIRRPFQPTFIKEWRCKSIRRFSLIPSDTVSKCPYYAIANCYNVRVKVFKNKIVGGKYRVGHLQSSSQIVLRLLIVRHQKTISKKWIRVLTLVSTRSGWCVAGRSALSLIFLKGGGSAGGGWWAGGAGGGRYPPPSSDTRPPLLRYSPRP